MKLARFVKISGHHHYGFINHIGMSSKRLSLMHKILTGANVNVVEQTILSCRL